MIKNLKLSLFVVMAFSALSPQSYSSEQLKGDESENTPTFKLAWSEEEFEKNKQQALAAIKKENPTLEELEAAYRYSGNKDTFQKILARARSIYYNRGSSKEELMAVVSYLMGAERDECSKRIDRPENPSD